MVPVLVSVGEAGIVLTAHSILHLIRRNPTQVMPLLLIAKHMMIFLLKLQIRRPRVLELDFMIIHKVDNRLIFHHLLL